ncbi:hypothetical protein L9F63_026872, partial [Diploptera punctata]
TCFIFKKLAFKRIVIYLSVNSNSINIQSRWSKNPRNFKSVKIVGIYDQTFLRGKYCLMDFLPKQQPQ